MKILLTGGCGFIGSAVIREFQNMESPTSNMNNSQFNSTHGETNEVSISNPVQIINIDAVTSLPIELAQAAIAPISKNYTFVHADICDAEILRSIFNSQCPDAVMHLAAETHVDHSITSPKRFIDTNIFGTYNLLSEALNYWRDKGEPEQFRFHHVSTDEVYGRLGVVGKFSETSNYDPKNPYSATKAASDHLVRAWHETYGLPVVLSNCSNNYGPFQLPEKLIPKIIACALSGKKIPIYGKGNQKRDWIHVSDHARALIKVLTSGQVGRSYNIGAENELENISLTKQICSILDRLHPAKNSYTNLIEMVEDRPGHDFRYAINPDRIRTELGWKPIIAMEDGLEDTVKWYLANDEWWSPLLQDM